MTTKQLTASLNGKMDAVSPETWLFLIMEIMDLFKGCKDSPEEVLEFVQDARDVPRKRLVLAAMFRKVWLGRGLPRKKMEDGLEALLEQSGSMTAKDIKRLYKEAEAR